MISLSLNDYGITPCSSIVYVRELKKGFCVYLDADKELLPKPMRIGSTKKEYSWSIFGRILCQIEEGWIGEESYLQVDVSGESGIKAEILVLCWGYPEGRKYLIDWLLEQSECVLAFLHNNLSPLLNENNLNFLEKLVGLVRETSQEVGLLDLVDQHHSLIELYKYLQNKKDNLELSENNQRAKLLEPFLQQINEALIANGDDRRPHPMAPSKSMLLKKWLRDYVFANGEFPAGKHNVEIRGPEGNVKNIGIIEFD